MSDVAKVFDALGFFSPVIIKMKILLQRLWEIKMDWDDPVPNHVLEIWLPTLAKIHIPCCYTPIKPTSGIESPSLSTRFPLIDGDMFQAFKTQLIVPQGVYSRCS